MRTAALTPSLVLLFALLSCRGDKSVQLSRLSAKGVFVSVEENPTLVTLRLSYEHNRHKECKTLRADARASFNGAALTLIDLGSETHGIHGTGIGSECVFPKWELRDRSRLPGEGEGKTLIEVGDSSATVKFEALNVRARRSIRLRSPAAARLRRGQTVELEFQPATDALDDVRVQFMLPACSRENRETLATAKGARPPGAGPLSVNGNILSFTLPADLPAACNGTADLDVSSGDPHGIRVGVALCDGAESCIARVGRYARLSGVAIVP